MTDKRKQRHAMGWVLVFFLGCDLAFLFLILFFRFGLYNTRFLAEAFEESGYYSEQETLMEEQFQELLSEAKLSELLEFDSFRDAFEREMRNQVYGRQGEVPVLTASSIAAAIEAKLDELGLNERSLLAEGGILLLSEDLGTMFHETGQIPGVASFWESERVLERTAPLLLGALCAVFLVGSGFLFFLRKRRRKYLKLLGAALAVGSLIYLPAAGILAGYLLGLFGATREGMASVLLFCGNEAVMEPYRASVFMAGAVIGGAGLLGAAFAALAGRLLRSENRA